MKEEFYFLANALDSGNPADDVLHYPGEHEPELPPGLVHVWRTDRGGAPAPDEPLLVRHGKDAFSAAAALTPDEEARAQEAYARLREEWGSANHALAEAEKVFAQALQTWSARVNRAFEGYLPVQELLSRRLTKYRKATAEAVRLARIAAETVAAQQRAEREAELDRLHGPSEWVVMRWTPSDERHSAYPEARRSEDLQPMLHLSGCSVIMTKERPTLPGSSATDWEAEPRPALRRGATAARLNTVLDVLAEGGATGYRSQNRVFANPALPRRPARLCGRCRPLRKIIERLGPERWEKWKADNPTFPY